MSYHIAASPPQLDPLHIPPFRMQTSSNAKPLAHYNSRATNVSCGMALGVGQSVPPAMVIHLPTISARIEP